MVLLNDGIKGLPATLIFGLSESGPRDSSPGLLIGGKVGLPPSDAVIGDGVSMDGGLTVGLIIPRVGSRILEVGRTLPEEIMGLSVSILIKVPSSLSETPSLSSEATLVGLILSLVMVGRIDGLTMTLVVNGKSLVRNGRIGPLALLSKVPSTTSRKSSSMEPAPGLGLGRKGVTIGRLNGLSKPSPVEGSMSGMPIISSILLGGVGLGLIGTRGGIGLPDPNCGLPTMTSSSLALGVWSEGPN